MSAARSWASFGVVLLFSASLVATSKPTESADTGVANTAAYEVAFKSIVAAANAQTPATPCTEALLETTLKSVVTVESWSKPDQHRMPLVDQPVAAGFNRANVQKNYPDDGFWVINAPLVRDLHPKSWNMTDQSDTTVSSNLSQLAPHALFALLRSDVRLLPKITGAEDYVGGKLTGKLLVSRMDTGAPVCLIPISAQSSPSVTFKNRGLTGKTFEKAIHDDFFEQVVKALTTAVTTAAPSFSVDVGT